MGERAELWTEVSGALQLKSPLLHPHCFSTSIVYFTFHCNVSLFYCVLTRHLLQPDPGRILLLRWQIPLVDYNLGLKSDPVRHKEHPEQPLIWNVCSFAFLHAGESLLAIKAVDRREEEPLLASTEGDGHRQITDRSFSQFCHTVNINCLIKMNSLESCLQY